MDWLLVLGIVIAILIAEILRRIVDLSVGTPFQKVLGLIVVVVLLVLLAAALTGRLALR